MFLCQNMGTGLESAVIQAGSKYQTWAAGVAVSKGSIWTDASVSRAYRAKYAISAIGNTTRPSARPTHWELVGPSQAIAWQTNAPISLYDKWTANVAIQAGERVFDESAYRDFYANAAVSASENTIAPSVCVNSADPKLQARYTDLGASNAFRMFDGKTISTTTIPPNTAVAPNNLAPNPTLAGTSAAIAGWAFTSNGAWTFARNVAGQTYGLSGTATISHSAPTDPNTVADFISDYISGAQGGIEYVVRFHIANHATRTRLMLEFWNASAMISESGTVFNEAQHSGGALLSGYEEMAFFATAPSGTTRVRIKVRTRTLDGAVAPACSTDMTVPYFAQALLDLGSAPDNGDLICSFGHIADATPRVRTIGVFGMFGVYKAVLTVKNSAGTTVQTIEKDTTYEYGAALHAGTVEFTTISIANPRFTLRLYRASTMPQVYCGMVCVGEKFHVGDTETKAKFRYVNYSGRERDPIFGDIQQFIPRGSSREVNAVVYLPKERVDYAMRGFDFLAGKPIMLDFNNQAGFRNGVEIQATNFDHLRMWGFVADNETDYDEFALHYLRIKAEGLVEE